MSNQETVKAFSRPEDGACVKYYKSLLETFLDLILQTSVWINESQKSKMINCGQAD